MTARKSIRTYRHAVLCSVLTGLVGCSVSAQGKPETSPSNVDLRTGQKLLAQGKFEEAKLKCRGDGASEALQPWLLLCNGYAEAGLGNVDGSLKVLQLVPSSSAASLVARALQAEIDSALSEKSALSLIEEVQRKSSDHNLSFTEPQILLSQVARKSGGIPLKDRVAALRTIRKRFPGSPVSERARLLQRRIGGDVPAKVLDRASMSEYISEIEVLGVERDGDALERLIRTYDISDQLSLLSRDEWGILLEALHKAGRTSFADSLVDSPAVTRGAQQNLSPFRAAAAFYYWKRSRYGDALKLTPLVSNTEGLRDMIEGRIADSRGDIPLARKRLAAYVAIAETHADPSMVFRLLLLDLYAGDKAAAKLIAAHLERFSSLPTEMDSDAVHYWTRVAKGEAFPPRFSQHDRISYYPDIAERSYLRDLVSAQYHPQPLPLCQVPSINVPESLARRVRTLAADRLTIEAAAEAKFGLARGSSVEVILSRARAISSLVAPKFGWGDLQSKSFGAHATCSREIFELLYPDPYPSSYEDASKPSGLPPHLALAITRTESAFDPEALSVAGAMGLMQLLPETARRNGLKGEDRALFEPAINIEIGSRYLMRLFDEFDKRWYLAIAAYNAGSSAVKNWLERYPNADPALFVELIPYAETRAYVKKVTEAYYWYQFRTALTRSESNSAKR